MVAYRIYAVFDSHPPPPATTDGRHRLLPPSIARALILSFWPEHNVTGDTDWRFAWFESLSTRCVLTELMRSLHFQRFTIASQLADNLEIGADSGNAAMKVTNEYCGASSISEIDLGENRALILTYEVDDEALEAAAGGIGAMGIHVSIYGASYCMTCS